MKNRNKPAFLRSTTGMMYAGAVTAIIVASRDPIARYGGFFISMTIFVPIVYPIYLGWMVIARQKRHAGAAGAFRRLRAQANIIAIAITYLTALMWWLMAFRIIGVQGFRLFGACFISLPVIAYMTHVAVNVFIMNCVIDFLGILCRRRGNKDCHTVSGSQGQGVINGEAGSLAQKGT